MQDRLWTCRDGRQLFVSQMEDSHIYNILAMMDRNPLWRRDYRDRIEIELVIRAIKRERL